MTKEKQYEVEITTKVFRHEYQFAFSGDHWGTAMEGWFEAVAHMWWRGLPIPSKYEYRPGMSNDQREPDSYFYALCEEASDEVLIQIAELMFRYCQYLKFKGVDY